MTETPEMVLARAWSDAAALRRQGFGVEADRLALMADEFAAAIAPIALVPEHVAMTRSGRSVRWLRERHATWYKVGGADFAPDGSRLYRLCVLPMRLDYEAGAAEADTILRAG
jgi:hypothetical protein